jgi:hypothetical protein
LPVRPALHRFRACFSISNELPGFFLQSREIITDRLPFLKMGDFGNRPEINTPDRTEIPRLHTERKGWRSSGWEKPLPCLTLFTQEHLFVEFAWFLHSTRPSNDMNERSVFILAIAVFSAEIRYSHDRVISMTEVQ